MKQKTEELIKRIEEIKQSGHDLSDVSHKESL
jgi:hypothetical protein